MPWGGILFFVLCYGFTWKQLLSVNCYRKYMLCVDWIVQAKAYNVYWLPCMHTVSAWLVYMYVYKMLCVHSTSFVSDPSTHFATWGHYKLILYVNVHVCVYMYAQMSRVCHEAYSSEWDGYWHAGWRRRWGNISGCLVLFMLAVHAWVPARLMRMYMHMHVGFWRYFPKFTRSLAIVVGLVVMDTRVCVCVCVCLCVLLCASWSGVHDGCNVRYRLRAV